MHRLTQMMGRDWLHSHALNTAFLYQICVHL